jgi:hypothetical protein
MGIVEIVISTARDDASGAQTFKPMTEAPERLLGHRLVSRFEVLSSALLGRVAA